MPGLLSVNDFLNLPKGQEPDYLVDTARINRRMAKRNVNPYRDWRCDVTVPKDSSPRAFRQRMKDSIDTFIKHLNQEGWTLVSTMRFTRSDRAVDMEKGPLPDCVTYHVTGTFKTNPKPIRIEVPEGLVKRDPEQRISLKQAMRAG